MYRFDLKESFPGTPGEVLHRSTMSFDDFVKYMPNVTRVEEVSRKKLSENVEEIVMHFHAKSAIPAIARAIMPKPKDINWKETYTVNYSDNTLDWVVETPVFTEYVHCSGTSCAIRKEAGRSEVHITGTMKIDTPDNLRVGRRIGEKVVKVVEPFIGKKVKSNLKKYFRRLKKDMKTGKR